MFDRFVVPTSTPKPRQIIDKSFVLSIHVPNSTFRSWHRFLIRFWCQHASIFLPKISQNCVKNGTWKASIFWSIFALIFYRFSFDLGRQLGAILALRCAQDASKTAPRRLPRRSARHSSLQRWFFGRPHPLLAQVGFELGRFGAPFRKFLVPMHSHFSNFLRCIFPTRLTQSF